MIRPVLITATLTGVFCSGFALVVDWATDMLAQNQVVMLAFTSGFLGSLVAQLFMRRFGERNQ